MGNIPVAESLGISSTTFMQCAANATEFAEITQNNAITPFKVTDFGTNRKLIYDSLHSFRDIAFDRSKIAIFDYPSCV